MVGHADDDGGNIGRFGLRAARKTIRAQALGAQGRPAALLPGYQIRSLVGSALPRLLA